MVEKVPWRQKARLLLGNHPQMIGLVVAGLATAGVIFATLADFLPLTVVAGGAFAVFALLVIRDLMDGDHAGVGRRQTRVKIAQVKRNQKRPAPRH
jgi:phosphatidylglycerophosphate synthase